MYECLDHLADEFPDRSWLVAGSGPLLAHRLIETIADLDIVVDTRGWERATAISDADSAVGFHGDRLLGYSLDDTPIEFFDGWHGMTAAHVISRAEVIDGHRFMSFPDVATFKRSLDRPKDRAHLAMLARHLAIEEPPQTD